MEVAFGEVNSCVDYLHVRWMLLMCLLSLSSNHLLNKRKSSTWTRFMAATLRLSLSQQFVPLIKKVETSYWHLPSISPSLECGKACPASCSDFEEEEQAWSIARDFCGCEMWNEHICQEHFTETMMEKGVVTQFSREPMLCLIDVGIDAYGPHLKWPEHVLKLWEITTFCEDHCNECDLYATTLGHCYKPITWVVYATRYDEYLAVAFSNPQVQTTQGYPRVPLVKLLGILALVWVQNF